MKPNSGKDMDLNTFFGLWATGSFAFIGFWAYKYRNYDISHHIKKPAEPTWPRTKLEEIFGI